MPTIRLLLLITGSLRSCSFSMCCIAFARSSSCRQQWMPSVIISRAVAQRASKLLLASPLQTMSRSVTILISWSSSQSGCNRCHAAGFLILPLEHVHDESFEVGALYVVLTIGPAATTKIIYHDIDILIVAIGHDRRRPAGPTHYLKTPTPQPLQR
jgi:hypothetical protein